jgi:hypothetical protein
MCTRVQVWYSLCARCHGYRGYLILVLFGGPNCDGIRGEAIQHAEPYTLSSEERARTAGPDSG